MNEPLLTPAEAARLLSVSTATMTRLARDGILEAVRFTPTGNRRFRQSDVLRLRAAFRLERGVS
ncbi:MAG: helix-turn-helix domain-containing protein [Actinobacteria bacterium]|nr:helix-turn-helix domain-containing protein [Actinomycetota bacterium]